MPSARNSHAMLSLTANPNKRYLNLIIMIIETFLSVYPSEELSHSNTKPQETMYLVENDNDDDDDHDDVDDDDDDDDDDDNDDNNNNNISPFPPCHGHPRLGDFDELLRAGLERILNASLTDDQWTQASLPIRMGVLESGGCPRWHYPLA